MTNELRQLIRNKLLSFKTAYSLKDVYYQVANEDKMFPHVVFNFDRVNALADDLNRFDFVLYVDVWFKGANQRAAAENLTDAIIDLLNGENFPTTDILPTLYFESVVHMLDEDKTITHNQIRFSIQNYKR